MADARVRIFNRKGVLIDELVGEVTRSWSTNDIGKFKMRIARKDSKVVAQTIKFGNLVYVESSVMPQLTWGGFLWPPREWSEDVIEIEGLSGEGLLKQRVMKTILTETDRTASALFIELMKEANRRGDTSIRLDPQLVDDMKPRTYQDTFYGFSIYDAVQDLRKRVGAYFWLEPRIDNSDGQMYFLIHWSRQQPYQGHQMVMNYNVIPSSKGVLREDGDMVTAVLVIGQGETLETAPAVYEEANNEVQQRWGLREAVITGNFKTISSATAMARSFLTREGRIKRYYSLDAPFMDDALLSTVRIGSRHHLFVGDYGFTEDGIEPRIQVRVKGIALSEKEGKASLVVQEVSQTAEEFINQ